MPSLCWHWQKYTVSATNEDIPELMAEVATGLSELGYTDVVVGKDVGGTRDGFVLAVLYLPVTDDSYFQLVGCGGSGERTEAEANIDEVRKMITEVSARG